MLSGRLTQFALRTIDRIAPNRDAERPAHLRTGRRGEEDAYFYLRRKGYVMIARNYRTARLHGEVDLIGWDKDVLCFIEVKTRTTRDVKPAEAAVDKKKRHDLRAVIRDYLRTLPRKQYPEPPPWRFDVITVYYEQPAKGSPAGVQNSSANAAPKRPDHRAALPTFELFQNATLSS
jgi:putative endonuclease